jgi:CRISPR-associated protein Cas8b1/Cst1 subtype I-B
MTSKQEHLDKCKEIAMKYLKKGEVENAVISMLSDLKKHPETEKISPYLETIAMIYIDNNDYEGAKRFIEGFR